MTHISEDDIPKKPNSELENESTNNGEGTEEDEVVEE